MALGYTPTGDFIVEPETTKMVESIAFRNAMCRLGAAVNVLTTDGEGGLAGLTASAVCSVTDGPPTLLACINANARQYERYIRNGVLCINVLHGSQEDVSRRFSGAEALSIEERFALTPWITLATGAPVLEDALLSFDCRISSVSRVGTHGVFYCQVEQIRDSGQQESLLYFDRQYHRLTAAAA